MVFCKVCMGYRKGIRNLGGILQVQLICIYVCVYVLSVNVRCPTSDAQLCQASIAVS